MTSLLNWSNAGYGRFKPCLLPGFLHANIFLIARFALTVLLLLTFPAWAQVLPPGAVDPDAQRRLELQREVQRRQILEQEPDVRLQTLPSANRLPLRDDEVPCFPVGEVRIDGLDRWPRLKRLVSALDGPAGNDSPRGRCLGAVSIGLLATRLQDAIIEKGYITTRVLVRPQDLSTGALVLTVVPGLVQEIRAHEESSAQLRLVNALPLRPGDLLDLRDMEQALENLQRVPGAKADIQVQPSREAMEPGLSDLVVSYQGGRAWRMQWQLDDSGSDATGRYPFSATLSLDHPLTLNDLFYVTLNRDTSWLAGQWRDRSIPHSASHGHSLHYSLPWGHSLLSVTFSRNGYQQLVVGTTQNYVYRGISSNGELKLSQVLWRDGQFKFTGWAKLFGRSSRNYIDDTEVEVQRRRVGGWELGLQLKRIASAVNAEAELNLKRGTGAFHALEAPEEAFGEGRSRLALVQGALSISGTFPLGDRPLQISTQWRGQVALRPLTPQDRFAIGGRYTVRGFDGGRTLSADNGLLVRNEAELPLNTIASLYLGVDAGWVSGSGVERLAGTHLAGAVIGTRWRFHGAYLDVFGGMPLRQPSLFPEARPTAGFTLSYSH